MCCGRRDVEKRGRKQMWHYPLSGMSWHLNVGPPPPSSVYVQGSEKRDFLPRKMVPSTLKSIFISL